VNSKKDDVMPAKAGIHFESSSLVQPKSKLDSCFRGNDDIFVYSAGVLGET
jgi:hypothetical protein